MRLSVVIPVYNEKDTIQKIVDKVLTVTVDKEIIIVDDASKDGTRELIEKSYKNRDGFKILFHETNQGKGSAIRTAIAAASGDAVIIQDADLEYDPMDYLKLLEGLEKNGVNVVYGSRFMQKKKVTAPWHRFVNYFLTNVTNILFSSSLTDMETCYKLLRTPLIKRLNLQSHGFEIEVELTARVLKLKEKIFEIPISYKGRSFHEGKKIGWRDGVIALFLIFKYRFFL